MTFTISTVLNERRVSDLLCSALEGGSNYWYFIEAFIEPPVLTFRTFDGKVFRHLDYPLSDNGGLVIKDLFDDQHPALLDRTSLLRGLHVMAEKYARHYADWMNENDDSMTGDVFLQCCLYGEVIYG
jgi:hypothetical protein